MLEEIGDLIITTIWMAIGIAAIFALYVAIAGASAFIVRLITQGRKKEEGFNALKTVTFGDESAVRPNRMAGIISIMGYAGSIYLMGWTGGYVLLALLIAEHLGAVADLPATNHLGVLRRIDQRQRRRRELGVL